MGAGRVEWLSEYDSLSRKRRARQAQALKDSERDAGTRWNGTSSRNWKN
jgi:hypothetical protein